ncbi:MAG: hypothetical protein LUO93_00660 [Methanomicrobiales archaeon]|nr:hypothetical protein [Methanomicrobiales archaeon]
MVENVVARLGEYVVPVVVVDLNADPAEKLIYVTNDTRVQWLTSGQWVVIGQQDRDHGRSIRLGDGRVGVLPSWKDEALLLRKEIGKESA